MVYQIGLHYGPVFSKPTQELCLNLITMIITLYSRDANPTMKREVLQVFTFRLVGGLGQSTPAVAGTLPAPQDHVELEARPTVGSSNWL